MKNLFAKKPKAVKATTGSRDFGEELPKSISTPVYQKLATHGVQQQVQPIPPPAPPLPPQPLQSDDERWEVVPPLTDSPLLPNPLPPLPVINAPARTSSLGSVPPPMGTPLPPRSSSPMSAVTNMSSSTKLVRHHDRDRDAYYQQQRKKTQPSAPVALGILRALDPPSHQVQNISRPHSEDRERYAISENGHSNHSHRDIREAAEKKEKRGFWSGWDKDKDREKEKERDRDRERERDLQQNRDSHRDRARDLRRDDDGLGDLTRMIGYLTATASEDWALVLEVCDRASANEATAKEAVRALKREFKYGEPPAQLSAARLWAIMLHNSSEVFIAQCTSRKFLDTIEELLSSSRTSPVVRERLLEVVSAAAYATRSKNGRTEREGFKALWKRVKPFDKPEEGVPFDTDDAMFHPPISGRLSAYEIPTVSYQEPSPLPIDSPQPPTPNVIKERKSSSRNRIIPPDEDIRRLIQECKIGQGNASLLSQALALTKPEDLKRKEIIKEFYVKCRSSQELIFAQIPWASAGAERSRVKKDKDTQKRNRNLSNDFNNLTVKDIPETPSELTVEENLLAALLGANAELMEALQQYEDLERVAEERLAEERSRKDIRMDRGHRENLSADFSADTLVPAGGSRSRTPSPSSRSHSPHRLGLVHPRPHYLPIPESEIDPILGQNLAPPPAAPHGPRSPAQISLHSRTPSPGPASPNMDAYTNGHDYGDETSSCGGDEDEDITSKPSAKALGKRKVVEPEALPEPHHDDDDIYFTKDSPFATGDGAEPEFENESDGRWRHPPVHFVYDAVAERSRHLLQVGGHEQVTTNGAS